VGFIILVFHGVTDLVRENILNIRGIVHCREMLIKRHGSNDKTNKPKHFVEMMLKVLKLQENSSFTSFHLSFFSVVLF